MAGRGRGRGKTVSFDVQALGFGRGEALPAAILQPPPHFPTQQFKPVPLLQDEDLQYMTALKQEFVGTLHKSPYYLKMVEKKRDIVRYSDKYQLNQQDNGHTFSPEKKDSSNIDSSSNKAMNTQTLESNWSRLPSELKIKVKRSSKLCTSVKPMKAVKKKTPTLDKDSITKTLENLEKVEEQGDPGEAAVVKKEPDSDKEEGDEELEDLEEDYDEDDLEEETDYALSYFDNGEGYEDGDGDDDEGPVY